MRREIYIQELKKWLFDIDYETNYSHTSVFLGSELLVSISETNTGGFSTNFGQFTKLSLAEKEFVIKRTMEYSLTPLDKREEPQKYYVQPKGIELEGLNAFVYEPLAKIWKMGYAEKGLYFKSVQNTFTLDELKELGVPIEHYHLEEAD